MASASIDIPLVDESHDPSQAFTDVGAEIVSAVQTLTEKSAKSMGSLQDAVLESKSTSVTNKEIPPKAGGMKPSTIVGAIQKASAEAAIDLQGIWKSTEMIYDFIAGNNDANTDRLINGLAPSKQEEDFWKEKGKDKSDDKKNHKIWSKVLNSKWFDKSLGYFKGFLSGMGDIFMDLLTMFIAMAIFDPSGSLMMSILQFLLSMVLMIGNMLIAILPNVIAMIPPIIAQFATGLIHAIVMLVPMIATIIKQLIMVALTLIDAIVQNLPQVLDALIGGIVSILTDPKILTGIMQIIVKLVMGLAVGLVAIVKSLVTVLPVLIENIVTALTMAMPAIVDAITPLLPIIIEQLSILIIRMIPILIKMQIVLFDTAVQSMVKMIIGLFTGLGKILAPYVDMAFAYVGDKVNDIIGWFGGLLDSLVKGIKSIGKMMFKLLFDPFIAIFTKVSDMLTGLFNRLYMYMGPASLFGKVLGAITTMLQGMSNISQNMLKAMDLDGVYQKLHDIFEAFVTWLKDKTVFGNVFTYFEGKKKEADIDVLKTTAGSDEAKKRTEQIFERVISGGITAETVKQNTGQQKFFTDLLMDLKSQGKVGQNVTLDKFIESLHDANSEQVRLMRELITATKMNSQTNSPAIYTTGPVKSIGLFP